MHVYPPLQHPKRYVWDFWYFYDSSKDLFHIYYLNADSDLVQKDNHHFSSQVGYGTTRDFTEMDWIADDVLKAHPARWDNTSIWSGDVIRVENGFVMFYTSRDSTVDDGLTQNIGAAFTRDLQQTWKKVPGIRIKPDVPYECRTQEGDTSIHAWRDPFLFTLKQDVYMLVSAKSRAQPLGRKGAIGLLRSRDSSLSTWEILDPLVEPGWYSEMEVPQIYLDSGGGYKLVYSTWAKGDFSSVTEKRGGLHSIAFSDSALSTRAVANRDVLLDEHSGLYACRIVPEMGGDIIGFDVRRGGIRRSGIKTGFRHLNRDFSHCRIVNSQN